MFQIWYSTLADAMRDLEKAVHDYTQEVDRHFEFERLVNHIFWVAMAVVFAVIIVHHVSKKDDSKPPKPPKGPES